MKQINEPTKWGLRLTIYGGLLFAGYMASAVYADSRIRQKAAQFCYQYQEGENVDWIEQEALALGAQALEPRWVYQPEDKTLKLDLLFAGLPPFDGYICQLYMKNNRLERKVYLVIE